MKRRQRKYQRVPANQFATIEVRESRKKKHQVVATIRSITCEGMGLHLEEAKHKLLPRGCFVIIRFSNGARTLELPAQVAWAASTPQELLDLGVAFRLEFTSAMMRQAYARWVVDAIRTGSAAR